MTLQPMPHRIPTRTHGRGMGRAGTVTLQPMPHRIPIFCLRAPVCVGVCVCVCVCV